MFTFHATANYVICSNQYIYHKRQNCKPQRFGAATNRSTNSESPKNIFMVLIQLFKTFRKTLATLFKDFCSDRFGLGFLVKK